MSDQDVYRPTAFTHPCYSCRKAEAFFEEFRGNVIRLKMALDGCLYTCEDVRYFKKYSINRKLDPEMDETDFLIEWINILSIKFERENVLAALEREQLKVWSERLSLILAIEEARLGAAMGAIDQASQIGKEI
jgi:hypothetical protein